MKVVSVRKLSYVPWGVGSMLCGGCGGEGGEAPWKYAPGVFAGEGGKEQKKDDDDPMGFASTSCHVDL